MNATPSRRWFRFSLRTALIVLTLACLAAAWVGHRLNWIRQRHEYMQRFNAEYIGYSWELPVNPAVRAPGMLWLFGERGIPEVVLYEDPTNAREMETLKALFPESDVVVSKLSDEQ